MKKRKVGFVLPAGGGLAVAMGVMVGAPTAAMEIEEGESLPQSTMSALVRIWVMFDSLVFPGVQEKEIVVVPEESPLKVIVPNLPIPEKEAVAEVIAPESLIFPSASKFLVG